MAKIYFKDEQGKKVSIEVSDEVAKQYRESLQEEWRGDAYESYYSTSLDSITKAGHDFVDEEADTEELYLEREAQAERKVLMRKLKAALPYLTDLQRKTIHKLFVLNMSQSEIAREEGVAQQVVNKRVARIYVQLKRLIQKNKKTFRKSGCRKGNFSLISEGTNNSRSGGRYGICKCSNRGYANVRSRK